MISYAAQVGAGIKSVQRGTLTTGAAFGITDVTISAVNVNRAEVRLLGGSSNNGSTPLQGRLSLLNSTTLRMTTSNVLETYSWEVTEWN